MTSRIVSVLALSALLGSTAAAQSVLRVDPDSPPGGDGTSWALAFDDLQAALDAALLVPPPVKVWVASGTYVPSRESLPGEPRSAMFLLPPDTSLHGGFAGHEASLAERSPATAPTVLTGDLASNDAPGFVNRADNAFRVLQTSSSATPVTVERLTITGGNANGVVDRGGGLLVDSSLAPPHVQGVTFVENEAVNGGAFSANVSCSLDRCTFRSNRATFGGGAIGLMILLDWISVTNSLFHDNEAALGGAVHAFYSGLGAANCTFVENRATGSIGGALAEGTPGLMGLNNCIFWLNEDFTGTGESAQVWGVGLGSANGTFLEHCEVSGWSGMLGGSGNHGLAPQFVDPLGPDGLAHTGDEDFTPGPLSPNVDAGRNVLQVHPFFPSFDTLPGLDLVGRLRFTDGDRDDLVTVDIGALERPGRAVAPRRGSGLPTVDSEL